MSDFGKRIKEARESMGWTQVKAGQVAGIDYRTIQRWELGNVMPDRHRVMGLAYMYGRPLGWFYQDDSEHQPPLYREPMADRISLLSRVLRSAAASNGLTLEQLFSLEGRSIHDEPEAASPSPGPQLAAFAAFDSFPIAAAAGAGAGAEVLYESRAHHVRLDARWLRSHALDPEQCDVISVTGDSMEPTLRDGCSILVDRSSTELHDGRVFVVRTQDGLVVKRAGLEDGQWVLRSDNPVWEPVRVSPDDGVIGEVRWAGWLF
jgi:phage repressor protein C with HTH and peptisase S24 domain